MATARPTDRAVQYLRDGRERFLSVLGEFIRIPSISTEPDRRTDVLKAAEWLAGQLRSLGIEEVRMFETAGAPIVYGRSDPAEGAPTVLIYGHYDVQPTDPLSEWRTDPFEPEVQGENLFARGASDMKGQLMAALNAVEAVRRAGACPLGFKFLFEGEEEIGSPHLAAFIDGHKQILSADVCLNPDAGMLAPDLPTITYALRGLAYFELRVRGPEKDLHSGSFGGAVHNPAQVLCEAIAAMHDSKGRVTLPGFYDRVRELDEAERRELARLPVDESFLRKTAGVGALWGEEGYTPIERIGARPTLEVNGLLSGFTGEGSKTVLPAAAMAKISMRLVADQRVEEVAEQLQAFLKEKLPPTVHWELEQLAGGPPVLSARDSAALQALSSAFETVWGKRPIFRREGGSVPVGAYLQQAVGMDSLMTGFALPDDNAHSPNEKLHLPTCQKGSEALVYFFCNLAGGG